VFFFFFLETNFISISTQKAWLGSQQRSSLQREGEGNK